MLWNLYKKEMRAYLRSPFQLAFTILLPVVFVLIMGYAMSNVVGETADVESEDEKLVLYAIEDGAVATDVAEFEIFKAYIGEGMNITWKQVDSFEDSKKQVDEYEAIALIRVNEAGFYYYRSPYNEPTESKVLRAAYNNMLGQMTDITENCVTSTVVEVKKVDSYTYFTFAELGFIMFYLALIVGQSVFVDKETMAFRRIYISDASVNSYMAAKVCLGMTISLLQIGAVYLISTFALNVDWGDKLPLILLTFLCLGLFSSVMGAVMGVFAKSRAALSDKILIMAILVGILGGGLTPVSFMESYKVLGYICKLSPLYWITNGTVALAGGQSTTDHIVGMIICLGLSALMLVSYFKKKDKEKEQGVFIYE